MFAILNCIKLSQIGGFDKVRSEEKWREAIVELGQKKREGGQERSGQIYV